MKVKNSISKFCLFLLLISCLSCARNPVTGKKEFMIMSESQEKSLGASSDPSIVASFGLYQDDKIQKFIDEKGQEMAKISHRPHLNYEFKVLDSPVVNAFAVPGGYVYFTRGILAHFNNEAEFAGVLGHEIGHITARHSAKQYSKQILAQAIFIGGIIVSEDFRDFADIANQGMGLLFLKFSRDNETESDHLGVDYSTQVGYDAHNMANFFKTLDRLGSQSGGNQVPDFLSTHPNPLNRYKKVHQLSDEFQSNDPKTSYKSGRDDYLKMIDGLVYGEDPRQGYVEGNIFYHPELKFKFRFPQQWQLNNMPTQVQMASEDGNAMMVLTLSKQKTLSSAKSEVIKNNNLSVIESGNTTVNGLTAIRMISEQKSESASANNQSTEPLRVMTYLIEYNNVIYVFHGLSKSSSFNKYFSAYNLAMKSFEELTDASKINKKPIRIAIRKVSQSTNLKNALIALGAKSKDLNTLAILNGMELTDQVNSGMLLKTLQ